MRHHFADFLFAQPSFMEGMARILDFRGALNKYNASPNEAIADSTAMSMDWAAVGFDVVEAHDLLVGELERQEA
jgi:hypothetical protein